MKKALLLAAVALSLPLTNVFAQTKVDFQAGDTIKSVLDRCVGQPVELRMESGEKIGGKVEKVGDKAIYLSSLTGAEYFDAVVDLDDISAVVMRAKK